MFRILFSHFYHQIEESYAFVKSLNQKWALFEQKNTYLTSREKHQFDFSSVPHYTKFMQFLLYNIILDDPYKNMLTERDRLLERLQAQIYRYNEAFVERRLQEYRPLFENERLKSPLDREQRRAVIVDDQHNLIVAAAGSGKTSVLTSRIAYLVKRSDAVAPGKILALAYNKSAAQEMRARLRTNFGLDATMLTFHSFGYALLRENGIQVDEVKGTEELVDELFSQLLTSHARLQQVFVEYMSAYLQVERTPTDFQSPEEYFQYMKNQRYLTLSGREVKSLAEREIANFFFMHDIACEYEKRVTWLPRDSYKSYHPDFYLPQYDIYIEHWGLDRNGRTAPWIDAEAYKQTREWKLTMFRRYGKTLVETWDYERSEGTLIEHLKCSLQRVHPRMQFHQLSYTELVNKVYAPQQDRTREVKQLITTVINHAKSNLLKPYDLEQRLRTNTYAPKTRLFAEMALLVYQEYEAYLAEHHCIDYNDMINQAIDVVRAHPEKYINRYDHILIDEFQDISQQRLALIKCFVNDNTNTKLFCVGDDWQSIYKFTGSDVTFFVDYEQYFTQPAINYLQTNYRSARSVVDASTHLISFNKNQRRKSVQAHSPVQEKIQLYTFNVASAGAEYNRVQAKHVFEHINELLTNGEKPEEIMVISRFKRPLRDVEGLFNSAGSAQYRKIRCLTVHKSKGSEAAHVFILSVVSGDTGFPSEIQDNSVLEIVKPQLTKATIFAEERRLFYVALTRSRQHLYLYTQQGAQSLFLKEIAGYYEEHIVTSTT